MGKEFAKIWQSWLDSIEQLPTEKDRGELALAIFRYALNRQEYIGSNVYVKITMPIITKTIDISEQNALNGQKGGQKSVESRFASSGATSGASSAGSSAASNTKDNRHKTIDNRHKTKDDNNIFDFRTELIKKGCSESLADEYIAMRKKKKASISELVFRNLESEIENNGLSFPEVILECLTRNWQGFKAEWIKKTPAKSGTPTIFEPESDWVRQRREQEERERQELNQRLFNENKERINNKK